MKFTNYEKPQENEKTKGIQKLNIYIKRMLTIYQNEFTNPETRAYFQSIGECYGQEWQNEVDAIRKALASGDVFTLKQLEERYTKKANELKNPWYDEDTESYRSGYHFESGFYETLASICRDEQE